jgi:hypothetical protein
MNSFRPQIAAALVAMISLSACVSPPVVPTIPVAPGPNKSADAFGADQAACQQYAGAQIAPAVNVANNQAVGSALLGTALGAGLGAGIGAAAGNAGKGAAIGAASGGGLGIIGNAFATPYAQGSLQQQYDMMYGQCMAAHGNSVASFSPPPGTPPYSGNPAAYSGGPSSYPGGPSPYPGGSSPYPSGAPPYAGGPSPYYGGPPPAPGGGASYPGAPAPPPSY